MNTHDFSRFPRAYASRGATGSTCALRRQRGLPLLWLSLLFAAALLAPISGSHAGDLQLAAGVAETNQHSRSNSSSVAWIGDTRQIGRFNLAPVVGITRVGHIDHREHAFNHTTWVTSAGVRAPELWHHTFVSFQIGVASSRTPAISSAQQFVTTGGWQGKHLVVMLRHISNASTGGRNLGETMAMVGWSFKLSG